MFGEFFRRIFVGRYGYDQLNRTLTISALILILPGFIFRNGNWLVSVCTILSYAAFIFILYRMFSRNFAARQRELNVYHQLGQRFSQRWFRIRQRAHLLSLRLRRAFDREHKYLKCPDCRAVLRVPRGKGKIKVTCKKCGNIFNSKS